MSRRTERLGSTIRQELAMIILRELSDPRLTGMPSITRVKVAQDLSTADVFVTVMGTPGQRTAALNALKHSAKMMRARLTKDLSIRQAPFLKFQLDEDLKKELEMMELLDKVSRENAELDRQRAEQGAGAEGAPKQDPSAPAAEPNAAPIAGQSADAPAPARQGDAEGGPAAPADEDVDRRE